MGAGLQLNVTCLALTSLMYSVSGTISDKSLSTKQRIPQSLISVCNNGLVELDNIVTCNSNI